MKEVRTFLEATVKKWENAKPKNDYEVVATAYALAGNDGNIQIFATNYNVVRIMSGMGGLAYSN